MKEYKLYGLIVGLTVTIMVVCDTLVYKVIDFYGFKITASGIIFSFSYILSTISTEVYGYKLGGRTVWIVILCQSIFVILINLAVLIPETSPGTIGGHFYSIYNEFWKVMIATWISVPASYFCNGYLVSKLKLYFHGKFFILRYLLSSMTAQAVLLLTAYPISLSSKYHYYDIANIIFTTWSYKVTISIFLFPLATYLVSIIKNIENTDYYDWETNYNPFSVFKGENVK